MTSARRDPPRVLVVRPIPHEGITCLESRGCEVCVVGEHRALTPEELRSAIRERDAVISLPSNRFDREFFAAAAPTLRIVSNYGVGLDHIDRDAAREFGARVTNTPGVLTQATAEMAWALLLATARRVVEADRFVREGRWSGPDALTLRGSCLHGKTLGVWGVGQIGEAFARMSAGFGLRLLYAHPRSHPALEASLHARRVEPDTLLQESDFLSLHVPLTPRTTRMIGRRELCLMKPGAILINTSRGAVIDEPALIDALKNGPLAAAGLDVFEHEPLANSPLQDLPNVILTPHIGSGTREARSQMSLMAAQNIINYFAELQNP